MNMQTDIRGQISSTKVPNAALCVLRSVPMGFVPDHIWNMRLVGAFLANVVNDFDYHREMQWWIRSMWRDYLRITTYGPIRPASLGVPLCVIIYFFKYIYIYIYIGASLSLSIYI